VASVRCSRMVRYSFSIILIKAHSPACGKVSCSKLAVAAGGAQR
jgi:hypothetical protein